MFFSNSFLYHCGKRFFASFCIVLLLSPIPFFAQSAQENTKERKGILRLEDALQLALEQNFSVRLAKNLQNAAENNNAGLRGFGAAGMLPNVNLNATWNESLDNAEQRFLTDTTGERILRRNGARTDRYNATVQLDWTLFNGLRMFAIKERLGEQEQRTAILTRQAMENAVAQVMAGYFTIVEQETLLKAQRTALTLSQERLRIVETKNRVGGASELDVQNALVDVNADSAAFMRQEAQVLNSKVALMQVLGNTTQFPPSAMQIQDSIVVKMASSLEELESRVKAHNSLLLASVIDQRIAALALKEAESFHYPTLTALVNYNFAGTESQVGIFAYNRTNGINFGVAGQVNIFNGFNIERQIQNAKIDQISAELQYGDIHNRITAQLHQTFRNFQNSMALIGLERDNVRLARSASSIALERFRLGGLSSLDLRQVQQNYLRAESRLITALADAKRAEIELMRLSGELVR
ncbi:MAG: TolC family protein [Candidatus Kapaibacterium sp.]|nr:MAG: TolC family protein [Candidatus Kapabacteria bacterium]